MSKATYILGRGWYVATATILLLAVISTVAVTVYAVNQRALLPAKPTPVALSPAQTALVALGDTAQADADAIVDRALVAVMELSARATAQPELLYSPAWREQWQTAWLAIRLNSRGELREAAITCVAATITTRSLDLLGCMREAAAALVQP